MNLDLFSAQIRAMQGRMAELQGSAGTATEEKSNVLEETFEAFNVTLEELRVAEEELREQNEQLLLSRQQLEVERQRYRDLFDFAPDGYLVTDKLGLIQEANRAASELLGVGQSFLAGKPLANFVPEPDRQEFRAILNSLGTGTEGRHWEGNLIPRHNPPFTATLAVSKVLNLRGEPVGLRWLVRDITARKRTEEQLRAVYEKHEQRVQHKTTRLESEVQWKEQLLANERAARAEAEAARRGERELLDSVPALIYEADAETGRYLLVSAYGTDLLGYPTSAWLASPDFGTGIIHADDREMIVAQRRKLLAAGDQCELEYRVLKADGQTIWVRDLVRIETGDTGRPRRLHGIITSNQRRKRAERHLHFKRHEVEAQFLEMSHLYDLGLRLSSSLNLADVLTEALKAATALQGAEMGVIWLLDHNSDELVPICSQGFPAGFTERMGRLKVGEAKSITAAAEARHVVVEDIERDPEFAPFVALAREAGFRAVFSTPLFSRGDMVLGTIATYFREPHTPSERQVRLGELYAHLAGRFIENARLHECVLNSARKKDECLALIGHELRTPLSSMASALYLKRHSEADQALVDEVHGVLERQIRHMMRLVEDLLDVTRIGRGELELRREPLDSVVAVNRAVETIRTTLDAAGQELSVHIDPQPLVVHADPDRLVQLFMNLLANAAKFTDPGGRIDLTVEREEADVVFRVRDNGIGIAPALLPRVFELFSQGERSSHRGGGLGIGLALVAQLHGGSVQATSPGIGRGSEFTVRLPLLEPAPQVPGPQVLAPTDPPNTTPAERARRRALVVDDDADNARSMARLLQIWGYDVGIAQTGPDAIIAAHNDRPDVVLLDIGLPGMNGHEVARVLRRDLPGPLLVFAVTGYSHPDDLRAAESSGFDHYLVKPIDLDFLEACLSRAEHVAVR